MSEASPADTPTQNGSATTIDGHGLLESFTHEPDSHAWLLLFKGDSTRLVPLPLNGQFTIGRGEGVDFKLDEHRVSRTHAQLTMVAGQARLSDLGSQNGTFLNDEKVNAQRLLSSGDVITIAGVSLVFHTSSRGPRTSGVLDAATFRSRAEIELERATRFSRLLAMVDLHFTPAPDRALLQHALDTGLRRVDLACWVAPDHLCVLLPEADAMAAQVQAEKLLEAVLPLGRVVRAGIAVYPDDGADAETLQTAARAASSEARAGESRLARDTFQSLRVGEQTVLVADPVMVRVYELVRRLAKSELSVLVHGETGSGKELIAAAIHEFSPRSTRKLQAVNCAAFQESLLESELFGHEKGAFTGATTARVGLLEAASGGTVFLDEVGEMSASLQAKLLRAIETRKITRLGDTREREVGFRVVAATHRDLEAEVKAGRFREDLYFRLAGATIWLPPLRDRRRELPMLARSFLIDACLRAHRDTPMLAPDTLLLLAEHRWPGNVRELKHVMEFAAATVSDDVVERWHLEARLGGGKPGVVAREPTPSAPNGKRSFRAVGDEVRELEQQRMIEALEAHGWNQTRACQAIGMPLRTFVTKFKQYDLQRHRKN